MALQDDSNPSARKPSEIGRRTLFTAVAAGGAVSLANALSASAQTGPAQAASSEMLKPRTAPTGAPSAAAMQAETAPPPASEVFGARSGSDYMVDVIKALDIGYVATLPGSSFRGLHESLIDYGGNAKPELLTCLHEEISVAFAHGYAKIAGKPMGVFLHSVVGLQHASMAIYNAWCDRVPIVMFVGDTLDSAKRREGIEWYHTALDNGAIVRDFVKWDAQPTSLEDFNEALLRAYGLAVTQPAAPVLISVDTELQEAPIPVGKRPVPRLTLPTQPVGDPAALAKAAAMLAKAEHPVIVVDRMVRTPEGMAHLVELAETLQCPVIDKRGRLNMPSSHYLNQSENARGLIKSADVILGLELTDPWGVVNTLLDRIERVERHTAAPGVKLITLSTHDLLIHSNFQDFERYQPSDLAITGDAEATAPYLVEAVKQALPKGQQAAMQARSDKFRAAHADTRRRAYEEAAYGWDASPVTTARLCAEIWPLIKDSDWAFVGANSSFQSFWPQKLWDFDKPYQYAGGSGGAGLGYGAPAAVGAALAHREHGRLVVNIQGDGELMCAPGSLWTAVHHKIPLLTVMHNNRAYHQETMHIQRMADRHERGVASAHIGTAIDSPFIDYSKLADSMGMWATGPITDPNELGAALKKAIEVVKRGEPALVDVVCQPR